MSWLKSAGGYALAFNRDELRTRLRAVPPRVFDGSGTPFLAPIDVDAGGTWLTVNAYGTTIGLLNQYPHGRAQGATKSRGMLVRELAVERSPEAVIEALTDERASWYRPFMLVVLGTDGDARTATWDGEALRHRQSVKPPLASSSFAPDTITALRREQWRRGHWRRRPTADPADLCTFQSAHEPERGPHSPCMHRADAATVSMTRIDVGRETVSMRYADGPPCRAELGPPLVLARRQTAATCLAP